jgi:hypothetical protein
MTAVGSDIDFGSSSSTTHPLAGWGSTVQGTSTILYRGGTAVGPAVASSTSLIIPSSGLTNLGSTLASYRLSEGNSVDITVEYVWDNRIANATPGTAACGADISAGGCLIPTGAYAVGLERLNWSTPTTGRTASTFMSGVTDWRTNTVTMP